MKALKVLFVVACSVLMSGCGVFFQEAPKDYHSTMIVRPLAPEGHWCTGVPFYFPGMCGWRFSEEYDIGGGGVKFLLLNPLHDEVTMEIESHGILHPSLATLSFKAKCTLQALKANASMAQKKNFKIGTSRHREWPACFYGYKTSEVKEGEVRELLKFVLVTFDRSYVHTFTLQIPSEPEPQDLLVQPRYLSAWLTGVRLRNISPSPPQKQIAER